MAIVRKRRFLLDVLEDYFDDLEKELKGWREAFAERPSWDIRAGTVEPLKEVRVTPTEVVMTVDLPLTKPDALLVKSLDENIIEVSAEMKRRVQCRELGIMHHEGEFQRFHCQTRVPVPVKMDKMTTSFKKGILEIHLPRKRKPKSV